MADPAGDIRGGLGYRLALSVGMGLAMSVCIGFVLSLLRNGVDGPWLTAFADTMPIAFAVAVPVSFLVSPLVQTICDRVLGVQAAAIEANHPQRR